MNYKVYFETLGCSKNQVDTEVMIGLMTQNDYYFTTDVEEAEVIVVNTCGFIESAKVESINTILELIEHKKQGKCEVFVVTGCMAERYASDLVSELPEVDAFIGTTKFDEILPIVDEVLKSGQPSVNTGDIDKNFDENLPRHLLTPDHFAYLKIAEGCDNFCTYCIIPKLRGKFRSRKLEDVVSEAKKLAAGGVKELIIIAQDTTRYGLDIYGEYKLADLLEQLNDIEGIKWIRLQYCYPDVIDQKLINAIANCDKVVKYLDIPIQHGSDSVLKRMNRRTSKAHIRDTIEKLRLLVPNIVIRTTLIVGFPGETDEEFNELLEFVNELKFDKLGAFMYSMEEDTAAALLPNQIDEEVKTERHAQILEAQMYISQKKLESFIGREVEVVIEEEVEGEEVYVARSSQDAPEVDGVVYVNTSKELNIGDFITVKIIDSMEYDLIGEI
ncbi:MAG: 30S ribosomal protein S12 methylthiotransferase RimO [Acidaminobacteraceae bacterium]